MRNNFEKLGMLIAASLFGFDYAIQVIGAKTLDPFSYNIGKHVIAFIAIIPFALGKTNTIKKNEIRYGIILGIILFCFNNLQLLVSKTTSPGKVGFITSLYIVEVPLFNYLFFKKKIGVQTVLSIALSLVGLILLCDIQELSFKIYDLLTIVCSALLAAQILVIEKYCGDCNPFKLNFYSYIVIIVLSIFGYLLTKEELSINNISNTIFPLLFSGIGCAIIACVLQTHCEKTLDSTTSSLILSLQSVFSVFAGYALLKETLNKTELIGCVFMFVSVILCIIDQKKKTF